MASLLARRQKIRKRRNIRMLSTKVWVDVFNYPCFTRPKMGQIVDRIGNRWFGEKLQFFLHEHGERTLGALKFDRDGITSTDNWHFKKRMEFPQTEVPENFKSFRFFHIYYFDNRVLTFFQLIKPLLQANKLILDFDYNGKDKLPVVRQIFGHLLPLIRGIRSVHPTQHMLTSLKPMFREKFAQIRQLHVYYNRNNQQKSIAPTIGWLTANNEPKFLSALARVEYAQQILKAIRTQFLNAKKPATFAVKFSGCTIKNNLSLPLCGNGIGEQLYGCLIGDEFKLLRHPANAGDELRQWLAENVDQGEQMTQNRITICVQQLKLGPFYAVDENLMNVAPQSTKQREFRKKNIFLPTEVWVEIFSFPWISRSDMGQIVDKIGNCWFGEQLQFFLHEWGKRTMKELRFSKDNFWPEIRSKEQHGRDAIFNGLEFPQTEMPENFKFFHGFNINFFDNRMLNFLHQIQPLLLTNSLNLFLSYYGKQKFAIIRRLLPRVLPLMGPIRSVHADTRLVHCLGPLFGEKLAQIKVLEIHWRQDKSAVNAFAPILEWLTSSNQPKSIDIWYAGIALIQPILNTVRQHFLNSKEPATFAVNFVEHLSDTNFKLPDEFHCENGIGEQLIGRHTGHLNRQGLRKLQVLRHPANAGDKLRQWLDENTGAEIMEKNQVTFHIYKPEDWQIDAIADENANKMENVDDDQQTCSSTKRTIARKKKQVEDDDDADKPCSSKKMRTGK